MTVEQHRMTDRLDEIITAEQVVGAMWEVMTPKQRVIAFWLMEGKNQDEIAKDLGVRPQSISSTVMTMKRRFEHLV